MAEFPALPLFTDAYLGDTQHLTLEEHGAYLKLLIIAWRTPDCGLPDDDKRLSTMLGITPKKWRALRPVVEPFFTIENGLWQQKRLTKERRRVKELSVKRSSVGKRGAEAKALKNKNSSSANGSANGKQSTKQKRSTHTHTHKDSPKPPQGADLLEARFDEFWAACPKKTGKGAAEKAWSAALKETDPDTLIAAMQRYARQVQGKDRQYVKTPGPWLNAKRWLDEDVQETVDPRADYERRMRNTQRVKVRHYLEGHGWFPDIEGPEPGHPGCWIEPDILQEFGFSPKTH